MDDSISDDEPLSMMLARKEGNGTAKANGIKALEKKAPVVKDEPASPPQPKPQSKPQPSKKNDPGAGDRGKMRVDSLTGGGAKPKVKQEAGAGAGKTKVRSEKEPPKVKKEGREKEEAKAAAVKRVKKIFDLPGQTRETPDELDPLRKFYSSLRLQRPESPMAAKWLCMHGLLSQEEAEEYVASTKGAGGLRSPEKARPKSAAARSQKPAQKSHKKAVSAPPKKKVERLSEAKKRALVKKERESSSEEEAEDSEPESEGFQSEEEVAPKKKRARVVSESESEEEVMPKSKRPLAKSVSKEPAKRPPKKQTGSYAVFEDGAMDSDSEDDKPLAARKA